MSFLSEPISIFPIKPDRSISVLKGTEVILEFKGYVTIAEEATDKLTITKHPVQQGAMITDHAYLEPASLNLRLLKGSSDVPLDESYALLLRLQSDRNPMKVVTGKRTYNNMLIQTLGCTTDRATENVLSIMMTLEEVIIVDVSPTVVPKRSKQGNAGNTGATEKTGKKSALKVLKEGIGSLIGG